MLVKLSSVLLGPIIAIANAWFVFNAVNVMTPSTEVGILHSIKNDKNDLQTIQLVPSENSFNLNFYYSHTT